jgi:hypothetical protein
MSMSRHKIAGDPMSRPIVALALALFALAPGGTWGAFQGVALGINNRGDVVGHGDFVDGSGGGTFVRSRGTFRFLSPYFVVSDINERGTAVGRYSEAGWAAEGALIPKAGTQVPVALSGR